MRYATQVQVDSSTCPKRMSSDPFGPGLESFVSEGFDSRAGTQAAIKIFTLGRFSIAIANRALHSKGKAKHRPLALLKALIALGGRDVAASRLCECLWPDSDGDFGAGNLAITVHRLRSLLQTKTAILSDNGKLSLNESVCWVDVWNFERLVNDGLRSLDSRSAGNGSEIQLSAALRLYAGDFLVRESEEYWMLAPRLRLKVKLERLVAALSAHLEHQNRYTHAVDICLRALELDPFNELFYRRLMNCHLKQGEFSSVLSAYVRCREALSKGLCAPVSGETERVRVEALREASILQTSRIPLGNPAHSHVPENRSWA